MYVGLLPTAKFLQCNHSYGPPNTLVLCFGPYNSNNNKQFNTKKFEAVRYLLDKGISHYLNFNGLPIQNKSCVKDVGILFSQDCKFMYVGFLPTAKFLQCNHSYGLPNTLVLCFGPYNSNNNKQFNTKKFEAVRHLLDKGISHYLHFNGLPIQNKYCVKDIGILFSQDCKFDEHITALATEVKKLSGWILRTTHAYTVKIPYNTNH